MPVTIRSRLPAEGADAWLKYIVMVDDEPVFNIDTTEADAIEAAQALAKDLNMELVLP